MALYGEYTKYIYRKREKRANTHHVATLLQHQFTEMSHKSLLIYIYVFVDKNCVYSSMNFAIVICVYIYTCVWINVT